MNILLPANAIDLIIKVTLVLLSGAVVALALRRESPAVRHFTWTLTLAGCVALALLAPVTPRLPVPVPWLTFAEPSMEVPVVDAVTVVPVDVVAVAAVPVTDVPTVALPVHAATIEVQSVNTEQAVPSRRRSVAPIVVLWLAGTGLVLLRYALGQLGLARLRRRAVPVTDTSWLGLLREAAHRSGVDQPVWLGWSSEVGTPITWGLRNPIVLLPPNADGWSGSQRCAVLWHEMAHIARGDILSQFVAQIACALFWFHPAVWMAAKRQRAESERACDDRVLVWGTPAHEYATHLLGVARGAREMRITGAVSIGMARPSALEGRLLAILDETLRRNIIPSRARAVGTLSLAALILPLAALKPVAMESVEQGAGRSVTPTVSSAPVTNSAGAGRGERGAGRSTAGQFPVAETIAEPVRESSGSAERTTPHSLLPTPYSPQDSIIERTIPAVAGERITLDLRTGGDVIIRGWDEPRVRVRARLAGVSWEDVELDIDRTSDGVRVRSGFRVKRSFQSTENVFEIQVPKSFDVLINSGGGELTISGVDGTFEGSTGGGGMVLDRLAGHARLSIGGGTIKVTDSDLSGSVITGGGAVTLSGVRGGLRGSSGSGPVMYTEGSTINDATGDLSRVNIGVGGRITTTGSSSSPSRSSRTTTTTTSGSITSGGTGTSVSSAGTGSVTTTNRGSGIGIGAGTARGISGILHIEKAGGGVQLDEALQGAVIRTGGGDIEVGESAVLVDASTGGGDVTIGPVAGSVKVGTGAGNVSVTVTDARGDEQNVEVWTGTGRVVIELPRDFDGELDLETAHTRSFGREAKIIAPPEWIQDRFLADKWDDSQGTPRQYVRATGVAGKGRARVKVTTVNGDIEIRRGR